MYVFIYIVYIYYLCIYIYYIYYIYTPYLLGRAPMLERVPLLN